MRLTIAIILVILSAALAIAQPTIERSAGYNKVTPRAVPQHAMPIDPERWRKELDDENR